MVWQFGLGLSRAVTNSYPPTNTTQTLLAAIIAPMLLLTTLLLTTLFLLHSFPDMPFLFYVYGFWSLW